MSNKFTTMVTNEGIDLLQASTQQDKKIEFLKIIGSSTAYSESQLVSVTYDDVANRASKNQEGTINNIIPEKTVTKMELLLDGHDVKSDYTLNSIFIIAKLKDSDNKKVFAVLKANQPQYMNAYNGSGSTNLQVNVGIKFDNADNISIEVNNAAIATLADLERLGQDTDKKISDEVSRATANENKISGQLESEVTRAKSAEADLNSKIDSEVKRSVNDDSAIKMQIDNIFQGMSSQRTALENNISNTASRLSANIQDEVTRATNAEQKLSLAITSEKSRASMAESDNALLISNLQKSFDKRISSETTRATTAESSLDEKIKNEQNRALLKENDLQSQVTSEITRAKKSESDVSQKISDEYSRAMASENELRNLTHSNTNRLDENDQQMEVISNAVIGRNLLFDTQKPYNKKLWQGLEKIDLPLTPTSTYKNGSTHYGPAMVLEISDGIEGPGQIIYVKKGETYIYSCVARGYRDDNNLLDPLQFIFNFPADGLDGQSLTTNGITYNSYKSAFYNMATIQNTAEYSPWTYYLNDEMQLKYWKFEVVESGFIVPRVKISGKTTAQIACMKLERVKKIKDRPTDWSPAPEDKLIDHTVKVATGRNLYIESQDPKNQRLWYGLSGMKVSDITFNGAIVYETNEPWTAYRQFFYGLVGEQYTFSCQVKAKAGSGGISNFYWEIGGSDSYITWNGQIYIKGSGSVENDKWKIKVTNDWQRVYCTYIVKKEGYFAPRLEKGDGWTGTLQVARYKLEKGPVATPWIPAPEDKLAYSLR